MKSYDLRAYFRSGEVRTVRLVGFSVITGDAEFKKSPAGFPMVFSKRVSAKAYRTPRTGDKIVRVYCTVRIFDE